MGKIINFDRISESRRKDPIINTIGMGVARELEQAYGKYLFVPFDIPIIKPNDMSAFLHWYKSRAARAVKVKPNLANPETGNNHFFTVNGGYHEDESWTSTVVTDIFILFPELKEQLLTYFPITHLGRWRMWSSTARIISHRDQDSLVDCPTLFRVKICDTNPKETIWIRKDNPAVPDNPLPNIGPRMLMDTGPDSNSFAWNNIRTYHGSEYDPNFFKILWIITCDVNLNVNRYVDLMDRSIKKYKDLLLLDNDPYDIYYSL